MTKARIGFIGAGWWATSNHMPLLAARPDVELAAVCRLGVAELEQVRRRFGFPYATEDYRALLHDVELDGVIVATPHSRHYEAARAALERGLHVMCEKPLCLRAEEARDLVKLAAERGRHLLVPYGWHYKPFIQQAKRWMEAGEIGAVQHVLCHMASPIRRMLRGERWLQEIPGGQAGEMLFEPDPATWADPEVAGGGYGHAQISHSAGMLFWLSGLRAREVYALMTAPGARVDLFDALAVRFDGGAIGSISGAGSVPEDRPFQVDLRLFGSEGMLLIDCERARAELSRDDGRHQTVDVAPDAGGYACDGPPHNFIDLILSKAETNWAPGEAAMRSVELLDAAYRSARSGMPETV
jgi:predicted dehydrogenase